MGEKEIKTQYLKHQIKTHSVEFSLVITLIILMLYKRNYYMFPHLYRLYF
jgi:hypothetical protein